MSRLLAVSLVVPAIVLVSGCSSSSAPASGCDTVCDCVANARGDRNTCMNECTQTLQTSSDPKNDCEDAVKSNGFPQCQDACNTFKSSSPASMSDFCNKCASCVSTPGFDEGFCDPFKTGSGGFDVSACATNGDRSQLKNPNLTPDQLDALGCIDFDHAE